MAALRKFSISSVILWGMVLITGTYFAYLRAPDWLGEEPDPRSQEFLGKIAAEINRSIPVMIDQETELMPAVGAPGMLNYNYRLVNVSAAQVDRNRFASGAKERLKEGACNRPSYFDKDKQHIATVDVAPGDCGF